MYPLTLPNTTKPQLIQLENILVNISHIVIKDTEEFVPYLAIGFILLFCCLPYFIPYFLSCICCKTLKCVPNSICRALVYLTCITRRKRTKNFNKINIIDIKENDKENEKENEKENDKEQRLITI